MTQEERELKHALCNSLSIAKAYTFRCQQELEIVIENYSSEEIKKIETMLEKIDDTLDRMAEMINTKKIPPKQASGAEKEQEKTKSHVPKDIDPNKKHLLVVDDEEKLVKLMAQDLEEAGFSTTIATSGNEAFKLAEEIHFDLVITDTKMPDGNGIELLQNMKKKFPQTPVIVFSTCDVVASEEEALRQGADAVFSKPLEIYKLIYSVRKILKII